MEAGRRMGVTSNLPSSSQQPTNHSQPPVSTTLDLSSSTCPRKGEPPFTVTTIYECTTAQPLWALVRLYSHCCGGVQIRDPDRKNRRIGPPGTMLQHEFDEELLDIEDTELVRLELGYKYLTKYTFSTTPKLNGITHSDVRNLVIGKAYTVTLRRPRWRWMFEKDMPPYLIKHARREVLSEVDMVEWSVGCEASFEVVE